MVMTDSRVWSIYVLAAAAGCAGEEVHAGEEGPGEPGNPGFEGGIRQDEAKSFAGVTAAPRAQVDPIVCAAQGRPQAAAPTRFTWTVDGEPFTGMTLTTEQPGDTVFPGYTRAGQLWECTVELGAAKARATSRVRPVEAGELDPRVPPTAWVDGDRVHYKGALGGEHGLYVEYGFDGWSQRKAPSGAVPLNTPDNDTLWYRTAELDPDGDHWSAPVELRSDIRAVHMIFRTAEESDDAGGLEYAWDLEFPLVGPYLTWNDHARPDDGIVINWASGLPGLGVVEYGPDEEHVAFQAGGEVGNLHHVTLAGLPPDTSFVYRVRDADGRVSPWASFRTAPVDADTFTWLVASDMQDGGRPDDRWPEVADELAEGWPDARFIVAPGDLAANDRPGLWWLFFDGGRELFDHVPLVPAVGNHDTPGIPSNSDTSNYTRWFDLPKADGGEVWYSLDYGRTRVFAISTEVPETLDETGAQRAWLRDEMNLLWDGSERAVDWAVAAYHHPSYDAGARFAHEADDWRPFTREFDGNLDLVLQAHEHIYQRFQPLQYDLELARSGEYGLGRDEGVCYVVTPSSGISFLDDQLARSDTAGEMLDALAYPVLEGEWHDESRDGEWDGWIPVEHGFLVVDATPSELRLGAWGVGSNALGRSAPHLLDEVVLSR